MRRSSGILAVVLVVGCGGSSDAPAQAPAQSSAPAASAAASGSTGSNEGAARARARQLGAAVGAWRRGHGGACPTVKEVLDAYALPSGADVDASGAPFTIECGDAEIRVFASSHQLADAQPYSAVVASVPSDPLPSPGGTTASVPVLSAEDVVRSLVQSRARICYSLALKRDPNQAGELHGTMIVNGDGSVKSVVVDKKATTLTDPGLIECLTTAMMGVRRPPSDGARTVKF